MSKVKNVRRRQARRWMMREWAREVAARTPVYPNPCWFRFPPALVARVMDPPTSGRRWKKLTESHRIGVATDSETVRCVYCLVEISDYDDDGPWSAQGDFGGTGTGALSERHWCEESPDHEHAPLY